ncbi:hypothetical protein GDO81_018683 [Engystomops pustulosus]|uniref:Secreted protein n=1 Tax=Engystomops pustulosus TaxID=76066 RepID=A0AAV6YL60_ENGPU|nr:hypothetical protein GDO81_018683 [Engystomops pustulosus]
MCHVIFLLIVLAYSSCQLRHISLQQSLPQETERLSCGPAFSLQSIHLSTRGRARSIFTILPVTIHGHYVGDKQVFPRHVKNI